MSEREDLNFRWQSANSNAVGIRENVEAAI